MAGVHQYDRCPKSKTIADIPRLLDENMVSALDYHDRQGQVASIEMEESDWSYWNMTHGDLWHLQ